MAHFAACDQDFNDQFTALCPARSCSCWSLLFILMKPERRTWTMGLPLISENDFQSPATALVTLACIWTFHTAPRLYIYAALFITDVTAFHREHPQRGATSGGWYALSELIVGNHRFNKDTDTLTMTHPGENNPVP